MNKVFLALGDSMSIDFYTDIIGGGAVAQFYRSLGAGWTLDNHTQDGRVIERVPRDKTGDLVTLTIGGNNLLMQQGKWLREGLGEFATAHFDLLSTIRKRNPDAVFIVGNVYAPQFGLDVRRQVLLYEANEIIRRSTEEVGARLADVRERFRGHEEELLCQLIEPNLKGATAIAELFHEAWGRSV